MHSRLFLKLLFFGLMGYTSAVFAVGRIVVVSGLFCSGAKIIAQKLAPALTESTETVWQHVNEDVYLATRNRNKRLDLFLNDVRVLTNKDVNVVLDMAFVTAQDPSLPRFLARLENYRVCFVHVNCSKAQAVRNFTKHQKVVIKMYPQIPVDYFSGIINLQYDAAAQSEDLVYHDFDVSTNGLDDYADLDGLIPPLVDAIGQFDFGFGQDSALMKNIFNHKQQVEAILGHTPYAY